MTWTSAHIFSLDRSTLRVAISNVRPMYSSSSVEKTCTCWTKSYKMWNNNRMQRRMQNNLRKLKHARILFIVQVITKIFTPSAHSSTHEGIVGCIKTSRQRLAHATDMHHQWLQVHKHTQHIKSQQQLQNALSKHSNKKRERENNTCGKNAPPLKSPRHIVWHHGNHLPLTIRPSH